MRTQTSSPLEDFLTLRDVARQLGESYHTAYALAVSGVLGDAIIVGRTQLFSRAAAEQAIRDRLDRRAARSKGSPAKSEA